MPSKKNTYTLPESLGTAAAPGVLEALRGLRGAALTVDAGQVRRMSALTAQVLLAAAVAWRGDGKPLSIESTSEEFNEALRLLGLTTNDISAEAAAS